ncbi:probable galactinol--sucrose galactosyltransferase 2 isoform X3 [Malus sylvestris]|uniref:probable galactinol--sucrose galactosyltransferase 2 isoform X3 n=1 Tax=Malus sylvestris TaxID=3752 RepID=UPI0010AB019B|nr:probable galactinol--sucrose galactosyltransferase 2 isoform X3 [Malus domestica]XP_050107504.1 probable galactinol--sucrose galactosyltransferase 2 isoform X3 [Malus sylvestris]
MLQTTVFFPSSRALPLNINHRIIFSRGRGCGWGRGSVRPNSSTSGSSNTASPWSTKPVFEDGILSVDGNDVLTHVPDNVVVTPLTDSSAFVGATSQTASSRHVFKLGLVRDVRLLSLFRFKLWWMIPRVGNTGSDIPVETQMLLLQAKSAEEATPPNYILFLPVLDGEFRSSLQGNSSNELEFCVESGDPAIVTSQSPKAVFVNCGNHPFDLMKESMKILEKHFGTFSLRESKQMPGMLDCFGWCTWDAFYQGVNPQGIRDGLKRYVYVWHALLGYWGGLLPNALGTKKYNPELRYPVQSPGNLANMRDLAMDCMEKYGVGTIDPAKVYQFYDDLHGYLVSQNVDGVKVDVQNILETISADLGGRVSLTRQFQQALEKSIATHFQDNSIICCMGQNTDSIYHSKRSAITRASDDYYPKNPTTQTLHIAAVAFNSIFLGEVVLPDWDMFYSRHEAAEFHAAARAVGGCGVYVSDKPGHHDFEILKRLVLPDGSILRARFPGRPSRDCLFVDPVTDGKSLLKIWNLNKYNGVLGIFNCQGAGNWPCLEQVVPVEVSAEVSGKVTPADIEYFDEVSGKLWTGDCAVYSFAKGRLSRLPKDKSFDVALRVLQCDVFTVSPIKVYKQNIEFAAIGLLNMYNSGGAVEAVECFSHNSSSEIHIKGRGGGSFGAYSSLKPKACSVNSKDDEEFEFRDEDDNLLKVTVPATTSWKIVLHY